MPVATTPSPLSLRDPHSPLSMLLKEMGLGNKDVQMLIPKPSRRHSRANCYANVDGEIRKGGGEMILGWLIFEDKGLLAYAEHHAVWRREDGVLVDITPPWFGEKLVWFIRDTRTGLGREEIMKMIEDGTWKTVEPIIVKAKGVSIGLKL